MKNIRKPYYSEIKFWNNSSTLSCQKVLIFSLLCLGLSSCSPNYLSTIVSISKEKFEQTDSANVKIFVSEKPKDAYQEISLISFPIFTKKGTDLDNLKIVAAQQGEDDAVIDIRLNNNFLSGVAIRWVK